MAKCSSSACAVNGCMFPQHCPRDEVDRTPEGRGEVVGFQRRVYDWLHACFGPVVAADGVERNHRFLEEALELVQALGCTVAEGHQLVDYVFGRDAGEPSQEVGGVMLTLAALCSARGFDMEADAEQELARVWTKIERIRAKQAAKPAHSPLPAAPAGGDVPAARTLHGYTLMCGHGREVLIESFADDAPGVPEWHTLSLTFPPGHAWTGKTLRALAQFLDAMPSPPRTQPTPGSAAGAVAVDA